MPCRSLSHLGFDYVDRNGRPRVSGVTLPSLGDLAERSTFRAAGDSEERSPEFACRWLATICLQPTFRTQSVSPGTKFFVPRVRNSGSVTSGGSCSFSLFVGNSYRHLDGNIINGTTTFLSNFLGAQQNYVVILSTNPRHLSDARWLCGAQGCCLHM